ncbi:MAG: hypothetical protein FJ104_12895 [Deltaproteobacteria bacterium]|nr:hypothetical protein [Deltaproteobacteria bacterium]
MWHPPVELSHDFWAVSADSEGNALAYHPSVGLEKHVGRGEWVSLSTEFGLLGDGRYVESQDGVLIRRHDPQPGTIRLHYLRARDGVPVAVPEVTIPEFSSAEEVVSNVRVGSNGHVVIAHARRAAIFDPGTRLWSDWATLWTAPTALSRLTVVEVAVGDDGSAVVVFAERGGADSVGAYDWAYFSRRFEPTKGWGESQLIARGGWAKSSNGVPTASARAPGERRAARLRLDQAGNAVFMWLEQRPQISTCSSLGCSYTEVPNAVRAARYSRPADAWVSTVDLAGDNVWPGSVTVMGGGDVIAFFGHNPRYRESTCGSVQYRVLRAATGLWDPLLSVPSSEHCFMDANAGVAAPSGQLTAVSVPGRGAPGLYGHRKLDAASPWTSMVQLDPTLGPGPGRVQLLALGPCESAAFWTDGEDRTLRAHFY